MDNLKNMDKFFNNEQRQDEIKKTNDYIRNKFNHDKYLVDYKNIESNIEDFLEEAERQKIPTTFIKLDNKKPLGQQGLDRKNLIETQHLDNSTINHIQRIIQIQSSGLYESLQSALGSNPNKIELTSKLWMVYQILVEQCCRTEYLSIMNGISSQQKSQFDKFKEEYQLNYEFLKESFDDVNKRLTNALTQIPKLESNISILKRENLMLNEQNDLLKDNHEREVMMRVKFEDKLNILNENYNQMQSSFELMTNEQSMTTGKMAEVLIENRKYVMQNHELKNDNIVLTANVTDLINEKNTINELLKQAKVNMGQSNNNEDELNEKIKILTSQNGDLNSKLQQEMSLNLTLKNSNENQIDYNKNSSEQLQKSLNQQKQQEEIISKLNKDIKNVKIESFDQKTKLDILTIQFDKIKNEFDEYKFQQTYHDEKLKNKDDIINQLKFEFESLNMKQTRLGNDHLNSIVKLKISSRCRQEAENCIKSLRNQIQNAKNERDESLLELKKSTDKILESKEKQKDLQQKQNVLEEKIEHNKKVNEQQATNHKTNVEYQTNLYNEQRIQAENWRRMHFDEECLHKDTKKIVIQTNSKYHDADQRFKCLNLEYEALFNNFCKLENNYNLVKQTLNQSQFEHDQRKLKLEDQKSKLDYRREEEDKRVNFILENYEFKLEEFDLREKNRIMLVEDQNSRLRDNQELILDLTIKNDQLSKDLTLSKNLNINQENDNKSLQDKLNKLTKTNKTNKEEIEDLQLKIIDQKEELTKHKNRHQNYESKIRDMQKEIFEMNDQNNNLKNLIIDINSMKSKLENYEMKSREAKELNFNYNSFNVNQSIQTDIEMDIMDFNDRNFNQCNKSMTKLNYENNIFDNLNNHSTQNNKNSINLIYNSSSKLHLNHLNNQNINQSKPTKRYKSQDHEIQQANLTSDVSSLNFSSGNRKVIISNANLLDKGDNNLDSVTNTFKSLKNQINNSRIGMNNQNQDAKKIALSNSQVNTSSDIQFGNASTRPNTRNGSFMNTLTGFKRKQTGTTSDNLHVSKTEMRQMENNDNNGQGNNFARDSINQDDNDKNQSPKVINNKRKKKSNLSMLIKNATKFNQRSQEI